MKKLMKAKEVADLLGISERTVYNWMDERKLPSVLIGGNIRRFRPEEIEEWLKGQTNNK